MKGNIILSFVFLGCSLQMAIGQSMPISPVVGPYQSVSGSPYLHAERRLPTNKRQKSAQEDAYRLTGYRYEAGAIDLKKYTEVKLGYALSGKIKYLSLDEVDSTEKRIYQMDPGFSYDYESVLSLVYPDGFNGSLLRISENVDLFHGKYLSSEAWRKENGSWRISYRANGRTVVPYGFEYAELYGSTNNCPYNWQSTTSGEWKDNVWIRTMDVTLTDCSTGVARPQEREVWKFNEKHQRVESSYFKKENGDYRLQYHSTHQYDAQGRETQRILEGDFPNPQIPKKVVQAYDEHGNVSVEKYELVNNEWLQMGRTLREPFTGNTYRLISQDLIMGHWTDKRRETYHYDDKDRLVEWVEEVWNDSENRWDVRAHLRNTKFGKLTQSEYYSSDNGQTGGYKWVTSYDTNGLLEYSETFLCNGSDCFNGIYIPKYRAFYENRDSDNLDYFTSFTFTDGEWVRFDSIANLYNKSGELQQAYAKTYDGNLPSRVSRVQKWTYLYEEYLVTNLVDQENSFNVYPNPFTTILNIEKESEENEVEIFDGFGWKKLSPEKTDNNKYVIDLSTLDRGFYFIRQTSNHKVNVLKLLKY